MIRYVDSSVLVASLLPGALHFSDCDLLVGEADSLWTMPHSLNEVFSTLTGGRLGGRVDAAVAARLIAESLIPALNFVELTALEIVEALVKARSHGVRGGATYDYMHLVAARKVAATVIFTLNGSDFKALVRRDDPVVSAPRGLKG